MNLDKSRRPPERPTPWSNPSWRLGVEAWVRDALVAQGLLVNGALEEVKKGSISCVLRVPTSGGFVYFKAASKLPLFVNEGRVTQSLANLFPDRVPKPLAVHSDEGWLLLSDLGPPVGGNASFEQKIEAMRSFARLHQMSASLVHELRDMGCLYRGLVVLREQIDPLLAALDYFPALEGETVAALRGVGDLLKRRCDELRDMGLPETLVHGDLHLGNAALSPHGLKIFDWTDACVAHPFMDLHTLSMQKDESVRFALRDSYLDIWQTQYSKTILIKAFEIAQPLIALHQAVSYQHIIVSGFDGAAREFDESMSNWTRKTLEAI